MKPVYLLLYKLLICLTIFSSAKCYAQNKIIFEGTRTYIGNNIRFIVDKQHYYSYNDILNNLTPKAEYKNGLYFETKNIGLKNSNVAVWANLLIENKSLSDTIALQIENSMLDSITLYHINPNGVSKSLFTTSENFRDRPNRFTIPAFKLIIPSGSVSHVVLKVSSTEEKIIPVILDTYSNAIDTITNRDIIFAILAGVILVMFFYNLFIYFSTKDQSYLHYVIYILFIGASMLTLSGFMFKYVLFNFPFLYKYSIVVLPSIAGVEGLLFIRSFLRVTFYYPKLDKYFKTLMVCYALAGILRICGFFEFSSKVLDIVVIPGTVIVYFVGIKIYRRGFSSAIYFLIAWSVFVLGLTLYSLRNFGLLDYSDLTNYTMPIGTAIEAGLLSFALADKINILQKEKREKEQEVIRGLQENERLIREQNIILEHKVNQRTSDLNTANVQLNTALTDLKDAQTQLVENAKMASLGQLTAGIAHEINNPINFVKSNINPLRLDIKDVFEVLDEYNKLHSANPQNGDVKHKLADINSLQQEIDISFIKNEITSLLKGIEEGAERTAEIVQGLRIFSRLDESNYKKVDIHDGIASTLLLLKNSIPYYIQVTQDFKADGVIECSPGEINQVFMNIINNAVQAISSKPEKAEAECIKISTEADNNDIIIKIKDSGTGMTEEVKERIFEPFFTTKDVGEGTGLGLSIVFKIIQKHKGRIIINTQPGKGSEFVLHLPTGLKN